MVRNIIIVVALVVLVFFGYKAWESRQETVKNDSGDFTCKGCMSPDEKARFDKENHGETADGNSERKSESARAAAEKAVDGSASNQPVANAAPLPPATGTSSMVAPETSYSLGAGGSSSTNTPPAYVPTTGQSGMNTTTLPTAGSVPPTDSQMANSQNGQRFAGSGSYLVYRQGNITYRLDTSTGHSCVIYATMEEWRKPIVMSNGCGRAS